VLLDRHGLLDKHVKILGDGGSQAVLLEHAQDLGAGDGLHLGDSAGITKNYTDLRWGKTFFSELVDVVLDLGGGGLDPCSRRSLVREGTLGDTLSWCVHASHLDEERYDKVGRSGDVSRKKG